MTLRRHILLMEMHNLRLIILEDRMDFLTKTFVPKIIERLKQRPPFLNGIPPGLQTLLPSNWQDYLMSRLVGEKKEELLNTIATTFVNYTIGLDPDPLKKNSQWLLNTVTRKKDPMPLEDLPYAGESLSKFMSMKKEKLLPKTVDINSFKTLSDLNLALRGQQELQKSEKSDNEQKMLAQTKVIYDGSDYSIISPNTEEAAGYFGRDTEWCTAWGYAGGRYPTRTTQFEHYNSQGPMYIVTRKSDGAIWQFHPGSKSFMDVNDRSIDQASFAKENPKVMEIFEKIDDKPFDMMGSYPVYKTKTGYIIKSSKGLFANFVASFNVQNGVVSKLIHSKAIHEDSIAVFLNRHQMTGDNVGSLYYRDGQWGTIAQVGKIVEQEGLLTIRSVSVGEDGDDDSFGVLLTNGDIKLANITIIDRKISISVSKECFETPDTLTLAVSRLIVNFLIHHDDHSLTWENDSDVVPSMFDTESATALVNIKPLLSDIPTVYKVKGDCEEIRKMVVTELEEKGSRTTGRWYKDRLVIEEYPNLADIVEEIGNDDAKQCMKAADGDNEHYSDVNSEIISEHLPELLQSLSDSDLLSLGNHMKKLYSSEIEHNDLEFDPSNYTDIVELQNIVDNDDLKFAARYAIEEGERIGAESEMSDSLKEAVIRNPYIVFPSHDGNDADFEWDSKVYYTISVKQLVGCMTSDREFIQVLNDNGWCSSLEDGKIEVNAPYYGWTGYDNEAAQEHFNTKVSEFLR